MADDEATSAPNPSALDDQDVAEGLAAIRATFSRPDPDGTAIVDGYGAHIRVSSGQLQIRDGLGPDRRERNYARVASGLRRVLIIGSGSLTTDSIRWCREVGVSIAILDPSNMEPMVTSARGIDDGRLRRQQARAPDNPSGLVIAKELLLAKLAGQAKVARQLLHDETVADTIDSQAAALEVAEDLEAARTRESEAANAYWSAWRDNPATTLHFATRDVSRKRIPQNWCRMDGRRSLLASANGNRRAERPLMAALNYGYAMAAIATRLAVLAVGLDAGLGIIHLDASSRDGLVLDLMEVLRPSVDAYVLELVAERTWRRSDFHQTSDGHVRLLMPFTHDIAATLPRWEQEVGPWAERVAHIISEGVETKITRRTPLTKTNSKAAQARIRARKAAHQLAVERGGRAATRRQRSATPRSVAGCMDCGAPVSSARHVRCDDCIASDPRQTAERRGRRAAAIGSRKRRQVEWETTHPGEVYDPEYFTATILPGLATVKLSTMVEATGLSKGFCSQVRAGKYTPHVSHWPALAALAGVGLARGHTHLVGVQPQRRKEGVTK
jgi:CRISPR-associated endonuclease Cas1